MMEYSESWPHHRLMRPHAYIRLRRMVRDERVCVGVDASTRARACEHIAGNTGDVAHHHNMRRRLMKPTRSKRDSSHESTPTLFDGDQVVGSRHGWSGGDA